VPEAVVAAAEGLPPSRCGVAGPAGESDDAHPAGTRRLPPRVLIVDDDTTTGVTLARLLTFDGFEASAVQSGIEGLRRSLSGEADALVLDLHLLDLPGLRVLAELRAAGSHLPVIPITGKYLDEGHRRDAQALGISAYLYKPLLDDALVQALRRAIGVGPAVAVNAVGSDEAMAAADSGARLSGSFDGYPPGTNEVLASVLPHLQRRVQRAYPLLSRDAVVGAVDDAAMERVTREDIRGMSRASLMAQLFGSAKRNLSNAWRSEQRRRAREAAYARTIETSVAPDEREAERLAELQARFLALATTDGERRATALWLADASTDAIADALGCGHLDPAERSAAVARLKERMKKRGRRRSRRLTSWLWPLVWWGLG
jgi:two-component system, LuxR family, response regulator FixJ